MPTHKKEIPASRSQAAVREARTRTGPETVAGRYMRRFWHPVLLSEELVAGRTMPAQILCEELTLFRGEGGQAHAVGNRCAHRGAQLSVGCVEGDTIRCLYHGWRYDSDGKCVERPAEGNGGSGGNIHIKSYPVHEYLGFLFIYMGEGDAPPPPNFPEFEEPGVLEAYFYERACNYFQNIENGVDEAHLPFTHRQSLFDELNYAVPEISAKETNFGLTQYGKRPDGKVNEVHFMMPNMLTFNYPATNDTAVIGWPLYLSWRVPIDDTRHKTFIVEHFNVKADDDEAFRARRQTIKEQTATMPSRKGVSAAILAGKAQLFDYADRPDFLLLQDDVAQCAQGVIQDRNTERLGRSDVAVVMLRRIWARELVAEEAGTRLTDWEYPLRLPRPMAS